MRPPDEHSDNRIRRVKKSIAQRGLRGVHVLIPRDLDLDLELAPLERELGRPEFRVTKLLRACGGCLGSRRRRRTWVAAISYGEPLTRL